MEQGTLIDPMGNVLVQNDTDVDTELVMEQLRNDPQTSMMVSQFTNWVDMTRGANRGAGTDGRARPTGIFNRDRYVTPETYYDQMRLAQDAMENDDIVGGVADASEALAFTKVSFKAEDLEEEDIFNQIGRDLDLDARLREMWRELFACSQFYCAVQWRTKTYKVRGKSSNGNERRKTYTLEVPSSLTLLDPMKVVPIGNGLFGRERLAYAADAQEVAAFQDGTDLYMQQLFVGVYESPTAEEQTWMSDQGISCAALLLFNSTSVFRHTLTRPSYRRMASVRMKSVFELLDLKHQLRSMDRSFLLGGANFIVLIKKGTDKLPGQPAEVANLKEQVRTLARLPVLVGDHRLSVEIITPSSDHTLDADRYATLDGRVSARLWGMFLLGGRNGAGASGDNSGDLVKMISRGLESRRHMLMRSLEKNIFSKILERNDGITSGGKLTFQPAKIDLSFDQAYASFLLELRANNDVSRETTLAQFGLDQSDEARLLTREADGYDQIFKTQVPFSAENPRNQNNGDGTSVAEQRRAGRQGGGVRNGGGAAPGSGQGQDPVIPTRTSD